MSTLRSGMSIAESVTYSCDDGDSTADAGSTALSTGMAGVLFAPVCLCARSSHARE